MKKPIISNTEKTIEPYRENGYAVLTLEGGN